jgi:hypothetical protein
MKPASKKGNRTRGAERRGGMPAFVPTKEQRTAVEIMVGCGVQAETIRLAVLNPRTDAGVSMEAFRKVFADELLHGAAKLDAMVSGSMARQIQAGNTTMIIWYQKNRWGWADSMDHRVSGKAGGAPIEHDVSLAVRFVKAPLSREQALKEIEHVAGE